MRKIAIMLGALLALFSCSKENEKVLPGVFVKQTVIETFPGAKFVLTGTASNYLGLASITVSNPNLGINQTMVLKDAPKIFPFRFDLQIPEDVIFSEEALVVEVIDVDGRTAVRTVMVRYIADKAAPHLKQNLDESANLEITEENGIAAYNLAVTFDTAVLQATIKKTKTINSIRI